MLQQIDGVLWTAWHEGSVQSGKKWRPADKSCERVCESGLGQEEPRDL